MAKKRIVTLEVTVPYEYKSVAIAAGVHCLVGLDNDVRVVKTEVIDD